MSKNLFEDELNRLQASLQRDRFIFQSTLPVFGPLVQRFRQFLNELSTRWYVDHAVKQQVSFDTQAVHLLRQMADYIQQLEQRLMQEQARHAEHTALLERTLRENQHQYEIDLQALTRPSEPQPHN